MECKLKIEELVALSEFYNQIAFVVALMLMHGIRGPNRFGSSWVSDSLTFCWDFSSSFLGTRRNGNRKMSMPIGSKKKLRDKSRGAVIANDVPAVQKRSVPYGALISADGKSHAIACLFRDNSFSENYNQLFMVCKCPSLCLFI